MGELLAKLDVALVVVDVELDGWSAAGCVGFLDRKAEAIQLGASDRSIGAGERERDRDFRRLCLCVGGWSRRDEGGAEPQGSDRPSDAPAIDPQAKAGLQSPSPVSYRR